MQQGAHCGVGRCPGAGAGGPGQKQRGHEGDMEGVSGKRDRGADEGGGWGTGFHMCRVMRFV